MKTCRTCPDLLAPGAYARGVRICRRCRMVEQGKPRPTGPKRTGTTYAQKLIRYGDDALSLELVRQLRAWPGKVERTANLRWKVAANG